MPLEPLKSNFSVLSGINNNPANGPRGHTCGISAFLTCKKVPMSDPAVTESISVDQVAANALGQYTKTPLDRAVDPRSCTRFRMPKRDSRRPTRTWFRGRTRPHRCRSRWFPRRPLTGCSRGSPPRPAGMGTTSTAATARAKYRQSVLDSVKADLTTIQMRGSAADNAKMDQYLTSLRELEKQIQVNPNTVSPPGSGCTAGVRPVAGTPKDIRDHVTQMLDLMVLAMQCDATRVLTFFYENTVTGIVHSFLNVNVDYHGSVTHHGGDATKLANYAIVNQWIVTQLALLHDQAESDPGARRDTARQLRHLLLQ